MKHSGTVAVAGRPNAGKSTLVNALVGHKIAIVSDKPQTTRRNLLGILTLERGQIVFVDTPGIHRPLYRMNRMMVDEALEAVREVDVRLLVIDASQPHGKGDQFVLDVMKEASPPRIAVLNKIDLVDKSILLPRMAMLHETGLFEEIIPISATLEEGLDRVLSSLFARLPEGDELYPKDTITTASDSLRIAEIIREKFLLNTREEIPYGLGVVLEEAVSQPEKNMLLVRALIAVDRENHKKIVLGKGGQAIKSCGTAARLELESTFSKRFFLELHVVVRPGWREDPRFLRTLTS